MNLNEFTELFSHSEVGFAISKQKPENPDDAKLRRFKEKWTFVTGCGALVILFLTCVYLAVTSTNNQLAINTAFSIASGFAGYMLRGKN